jgi:glycerophosphoryl diester phosphodiesterase
MSRPLIVAHRALTPGAFENTREAISIAAGSGADLIELDIRLSLDRQPIVIHDAFLRRVTHGRGWVRIWPSFALSRLALRDNPGQDRVTSLKSVIQSFPEHVQIALHVKDRTALAPVLRTIVRHGNPGRTWLWLEHPPDVFLATRRLPEVRVTLLRPGGWTPSNRGRYFEEAQWVGASGVSVPWGVIDRDLIQHAHRHQLKVFSRLERWDTIGDLVAHGLDGIITDDPRAVADALALPDDSA